jgi:LPXTG-motif cell wall-anchored protein
VTRKTGVILVWALALLALWQPSAAAAQGEVNVPGRVPLTCGSEHTGKAKFNPYGPGDGPPPIAIGDSTMLFPIPDLNKVGFDVNARGCRGFKQAIWIARDMRNRGVLPKLILVNSYGNGGIDDDLIKFALKVIGPKRTLALVTAYDADTGHPPAPDTDVLVKAARDHPDQIKLLDWVRYSLPHHEVDPAPGAWFLPDLFHPNIAGSAAYAHFLSQVLPQRPELQSSGGGSGGGTPWWPFALGGAILVAAGALFLRRRRVGSQS